MDTLKVEIEAVKGRKMTFSSSIGGTELTPFLRRNLISVRRNTLTR